MQRKSIFFTYFKNLFILMLICMVVIIGLFSFTMYNYTKSQEEIYRMRTKEQTNQLVSSVFNDCTNFFVIINSSPVISEIAATDIDSIPDSEVYNISSPLTRMLADKIQTLSNAYIKSASIYIPEKNVTLSNSGMDATGRYDSQSWYYDGFAEDQKNNTLWIKTINNASYMGIYNKMNTNIYNSEIMAVIINLNNVKYSIQKNLTGNDSFYLVDLKNNSVIFSVQSSDNTALTAEEISSINRKKEYVISEYNVACIYRYDDSKIINQALRSILPILPWILIICLAFSLIVSHFFAHTFYKPINTIVSVLNSPENKTFSDGLKTNYKYSEIKYIIEEIIKSNEDKKITQKKLSDNLIQLNHAKHYAMQAQIHPHFIYNTLDLIYLESYKQLGKDNKVSEMIYTFAELLRFSFRNTGNLISIKRELEHIEKYLKIQLFKYSDEFEVQWDIDDEVLKYLCPRLILQPVIENALIHGVIPAKKHCVIKISVVKKDDSIAFIISDNGVGISSKKLDEINEMLNADTNNIMFEHMGIINVHSRIRIMFGDKYGYKILSSDGSGTTVEISIPIISPDSE